MILLGLLGIALQFAFKVILPNKGIPSKSELSTQLLIIGLSAMLVFITSALSHYISPLELAGRWLAIGTFTIGYTSYSLLSKLVIADDNA